MSPLISGQKENFHIISSISLTSGVRRNHALENSVCVWWGVRELGMERRVNSDAGSAFWAMEFRE